MRRAASRYAGPHNTCLINCPQRPSNTRRYRRLFKGDWNCDTWNTFRKAVQRSVQSRV